MPKLTAVIGQNLARRLKENSLTQTKFAELVGTSFKTINTYIKGKAGVSEKMIAKFAEVLEIEESDLVLPVPDQFIEFVREARKHEEFYRNVMKQLQAKMDAQAKTFQKVFIDQGILKSEDLSNAKEISEELSALPDFTFESQAKSEKSLLRKELDDVLSDLSDEEMRVLIRSAKALKQKTRKSKENNETG